MSTMTEEAIRQDRQERVDKCKAEIEVILKKYQLALIAEDFLTPNTKVTLTVEFLDVKKHPQAEVAQPDTAKVEAVIDTPNGVAAVA